MNSSGLTDKVKNIALDVGFDLVGIAEAKQYPEMFSFIEWVKSGYAADMNYLTDKISPRLNIEEVLPEVKSVISCGILYDSKRERSIDQNEAGKAWISRYAWNKDYHFIVQKKLDQLIERMENDLNLTFNYKRYVDTGPILDRVLAYHAGLGWFGKNSCLIHPKLGSYFFIGEILVDIDLNPDEPIPDYCGTCTRCIEACPTDAIVKDGVVDSNKCISYQTIENRKIIPENIRADIGHHVFGCDICQEVCPWNNKSPITSLSDFHPGENKFYPEIKNIFYEIINHYPDAFSKSPMKRAKRSGLLRNVIIVIANSGVADFIPLLKSLSFDSDEVLKKTRDWAIQQLEQ